MKESESAQPTADPVRNATREETDRAEYWDQIYAEAEGDAPGWDLGGPNPELVWQLNHAQPRIEPCHVLVPGCGYGHDLVLFAERGFQAVGVDMAPLAVAGARARLDAAGLTADVLEQDIFQLDAQHHGRYDLLYEYTCFCAIHPERRREYAELAQRLLKPGGQLIGCFYHHRNPGGPPYDATPEQVRQAFDGLFEMRTLAYAQHSVERRREKELWARFWRK